MAKLTLADVSNIGGNPNSAANVINNNNQLIEEALENTLSRNGSTPNQMLVDLDMNGSDLINVGNVDADDITIDGTSLATQVAAAAQSAQDASNSATEAAESASDAQASAVAAQAAQEAAEALVDDFGTAAFEDVEFFATAEQGNKADITDITRDDAALIVIHPNVTSVRTNGYAMAGDGGAALYKKVAVEPAHGGKFQSSDGAWWELAEDFPTPRMFGALGDGLTDDSAAIQLADTVAAAMGKILHFPEGVYPANGLLQTAGWSMSKGAKILYNGPLEGEGLRCSATGLVSGDINIDGAGLEPRTLFYIDGSDNTFGDVNASNVSSGNQAWVVRTVYVTGNRNKFGGVHFLNLINAGNINDSSPQAYVTDATANMNIVENITARNARSAVVNAASGTNIYGDVVAVDAKDNGFYSVAGHATLNSLTYDGDDNAAGFRSGASATINLINIIRSVSTSVFFGDCGDITIGEILVHDNANSVLHLNNAATGHIKIGTIKGTLRNAAPFAMPAASGTVESLTIDVVDLRVAVDSLAGFSQSSFIRLDACKGINLGKFDIDVVLSGISSSTFFYGYVNAALTYNSVVESFRVGMYDADGVTPHPTCTFFARDFLQEKMSVLEGIVRSDGFLAGISPGFFQPGRLVAGAAPTAGTWRRGALVWAQSPTASTKGWICTVAGTPGTWEVLAQQSDALLTAIAGLTTAAGGFIRTTGVDTVAAQAIVGTVSQSGGNATGAIVEKGSNANGEYVKLADGTQICWVTLNDTTGVATAAGSLFETGADLTWTYPLAFLTNSSLSVVGSAARNDRICGISIRSQSASATTYRFWVTSSLAAGGSMGARLVAVGRWF